MSDEELQNDAVDAQRYRLGKQIESLTARQRDIGQQLRSLGKILISYGTALSQGGEEAGHYAEVPDFDLLHRLLADKTTVKQELIAIRAALTEIGE